MCHNLKIVSSVKLKKKLLKRKNTLYLYLTIVNIIDIYSDIVSQSHQNSESTLLKEKAC